MKLTLYQTLEDRENPDQIERDGPYKCTTTTAWLGHGYYFWDGHIELAHFWGSKILSRVGYIICKAYAFNDESCWDLHNRAEHRIEFENICKELIENRITTSASLKVSHAVEYMKRNGVFKYEAVRMLTQNTISANNSALGGLIRHISVIGGSNAYFDIFPPVQVCLIKKNALSLRDFKIVYPKVYIDDMYA